MRSGYTPVAKTEQDAQVVLVAGANSRIRSLDDARGKRIVLPHQESLVSYMVRGEMNLKSDVARDWIGRNPGATAVKTLASVPQAGVVVSDKLSPDLRDRIRTAFTRIDANLEARLKRARVGGFDPADRHDFEFVSTRGFYTPEVLAGVSIPTAEQVKSMLDQGVPLIDVRPHAHFREGHIPGAVNVTYVMNSPKEIEYDDSVDSFDLSKLPKDKNAPLIVQCNGAECWYSYKAARYLLKRGYTKIHWFRTGLPAWKAAGQPVRRGS